MRKRRILTLLVVTMAGFGTAAAVAGVPIAPAQTAQTAHGQARLSVGVGILRFSGAGRRQTASGIVKATLTDNRGRKTTIHSRVALTASTGGGCRVLHLFLQQLNLKLLGLTAHLDKVTLDVTGQPRGGVLGKLFCRLARARIASVRHTALRRLNAAVQRRSEVVRFSANLTPQSRSHAAGRTCPVLDLIVGPLNLQLLGLVVNLQKVHLNVVATRGGGVLGDLFCKLADNSTTSTTS